MRKLKLGFVISVTIVTMIFSLVHFSPLGLARKRHKERHQTIQDNNNVLETIQDNNNVLERTEANNNVLERTEATPYGKEIINVIRIARRMNVKPLLVTLINGAYLPFALSWLCNTKFMGIHNQVLIITTDHDTRDRILQLWPNVNIVAISGMPLHDDQSYSHVGYVRLTNFRAHVLLELLLDNQEIFLFEVDALWIRNPVPSLSQVVGYDILANPVSQRPTLTAIGFLYMFPTKATILTWKELNRKLYDLDKKIKSLPPGKLISEGDNDQIYLSGLVNKHIGGLKKKVLPLAEYSDGKWYEMSESKRNASNPYVINNNWIIGNKKKISRAKRWGHWFLNEDNSCNFARVKTITDN